MLTQTSHRERGQSTVAMAMVILLLVILTWVIAQFGAAAIERARAQALADSIALAEADVPGSAAMISAHFGPHTFAIAVGPGSVYVQGHQTQAQAFATASTEPPDVAPAVVAIVARAAQLTSVALEPTRMQATSATFDSASGATFAAVAFSLGMCPADELAGGAGGQTFELC